MAIIKAFQRIILAQTKLAPGEQSSSNDANLLIVPPNHTALRVSKLEAEANKLLTSVITLQYTSKSVQLFSIRFSCADLPALLLQEHGSRHGGHEHIEHSCQISVTPWPHCMPGDDRVDTGRPRRMLLQPDSQRGKDIEVELLPRPKVRARARISFPFGY